MPLPAAILTSVIETTDPFEDSARENAISWCNNNNFADRAKLIELQLIRAIYSYDPDENTVALDSKLRFLLEAQKSNFLHFDGLENGADEFIYHRGFVEYIKISAGNFLKNAPGLFALAPIRHIDVTGLGEYANEFFQSPFLKNILSLGLDGNDLTDDHALLIANSDFLGNLTWLSLMSNKIELHGIAALAESKKLAKLRYVNFLDNTVNPSDYQSVDQGVILEHFQSKAGAALENRCGYISWLHSKAEHVNQLRPNRFIFD